MRNRRQLVCVAERWSLFFVVVGGDFFFFFCRGRSGVVIIDSDFQKGSRFFGSVRIRNSWHSLVTTAINTSSLY